MMEQMFMSEAMINNNQKPNQPQSDLKLIQEEEATDVVVDEDANGGGEDADDDTPEIDINIHNVVCNFATRCHLNLRHIANTGANVIYKREQAMVSLKLRNPKSTASIWSSGKITITGAGSEPESKRAARRIARMLQKMGFTRVKFTGFRIVNVLGIVNLPFGIKIDQFTQEYPRLCR